MYVLGIESTCDETAASVVLDGKKILSNIIQSQTEIHEGFGGVFPEFAAREHQKILFTIIDQALTEAGISMNQIDLIAVARGPGLIGSILMGLQGAKILSLSLQKPLIGVNHIEAHIYAAMMDSSPVFPSLGLVLSGGHTNISHMPSFGKYTNISTTVDDAIGEAFDKVGSLLGIPYPGGAKVEKIAEQGDAYSYPFKPAKVKNAPLAFSFSGLKTAVSYALKKETTLTDQIRADIAASFQRAAFDAIKEKISLALTQYESKAIYLGGGVTGNQYFRELMKKCFSLPIHFPKKELCMDNAAMIAGLGYQLFQKQGSDPLTVGAEPRIPLG